MSWAIQRKVITTFIFPCYLHIHILDLVYVGELSSPDEASSHSAQPYTKTLVTPYTHSSTYSKNFSFFIREPNPNKLSSAKHRQLVQIPLKDSQNELEINLLKSKNQTETQQREIAKNLEKWEKEDRRLENSKTIKLQQDISLPPAKFIKINEVNKYRDQRVNVKGWVHHMRFQGKDLMLIVLRDGTANLQSILTDRLCHTYDALTLTLESTVSLFGTIKTVIEGKSAPGDHELIVDYWEVISKAPGDSEAVANKASVDSDPSIQYAQRHLLIRGDTESAVLKVRSYSLRAFRVHFHSIGYLEITPPSLEQKIIEGGSSIFSLPYYDAGACLSQSSQLYLESCVPALGNVYTINESFRAEKLITRRHLTEYTHLEVEAGFITFEDLLDMIENAVCGTIDFLLKDPVSRRLIEQLNPGFVTPTRPFMRMRYEDAIKWLNEHEVKRGDGNDFMYGDDIPESPERLMTDTINRPIFLTHFPGPIKSFYMPRSKDDPRVTDSVDLLVPNVGEIVGGSMRISNYEDMLSVFKTAKLNPDDLYWYLDLSKYGAFPHGGFGLGVERFLAWITNRYSVLDCCLYPRFPGNCKP
ncbi:Asparagine-tRNA ligase, cytoplasmic [Smittium mucronatum]|uniref:asparagine--tRNA ligase n=1 Tax=Smittium mucronatum TaxID=133383 RepID=A0A1R0GL64_9FUNG|nr:Asparagine-tRNA ligase, cytoplasmic [Smittium mucronatum]OLY78582.1 Asparagine-tRNA ligase, cytoplasmic [Smittium mucronatum]